MSAHTMPPKTKDQHGWCLDNTYAQLPENWFTYATPTPVKAPQMAIFNHALAAELGLTCPPDTSATWLEDMTAICSGNGLPAGSTPLAQAYAGHQFGHFTMLGDGRALLLGEQITPDGHRWDVQLKGSGPTPYSRRGDGRAALGPMWREYIISEAMHALGIPTTRSLAVVATGEPVHREQTLPGAVLTRVAASHIRVGTFQFVAAMQTVDAIKTLADYTINRHYPDLLTGVFTEALPGDNCYVAFLHAAMQRQIALVVNWMRVGFVHGVMNTDNMALSGETIDYGPCAFIDAYDPSTVFSSIDRDGRYAFGSQPGIALWNLTRLAESLLPLFANTPEAAIGLAEGVLNTFSEEFSKQWLHMMGGKLGILDITPADQPLVDELLSWMKTQQADYTQTFTTLTLAAALSHEDHDQENLQHTVGPALSTDAPFMAWLNLWQARRATQAPTQLAASLTAMQSHNPVIIPRNHQVELALAAACTGNTTPALTLLAALAQPYAHHAAFVAYQEAPPPNSPSYKTFCGT
jgi:serine/tyrosine/threonine adenylyltransferase